jgi:hypothetical protein
MKRDDENGIDERSHKFFVNVLAFVDTIPIEPKTKKLIEQLAASAGSIGAIGKKHWAARREKSSSGSTRSRCAGQTSPCAGCELARSGN